VRAEPSSLEDTANGRMRICAAMTHKIPKLLQEWSGARCRFWQSGALVVYAQAQWTSRPPRAAASKL
jgi:hypothetical protein